MFVSWSTAETDRREENKGNSIGRSTILQENEYILFVDLQAKGFKNIINKSQLLDLI